MSGVMSARLPETFANVSRETFDRLALFEACLRKWNARINLIGSRDIGAVWTRHIADSMRILSHLPPTGTIVDLGSGAGFPGLIIAIVTGRRITLVEADHRKAAFLRECARKIDLPVTIIADRIERCGLRGIDIITARALARLPRLLDLAFPLLGPGGMCLLLKGHQVEAELTEARQRWQMDVRCHPGASAQDGCLLEVTHLRRVHAA